MAHARAISWLFCQVDHRSPDDGLWCVLLDGIEVSEVMLWIVVAHPLRDFKRNMAPREKPSGNHPSRSTVWALSSFLPHLLFFSLSDCASSKRPPPRPRIFHSFGAGRRV